MISVSDAKDPSPKEETPDERERREKRVVEVKIQLEELQKELIELKKKPPSKAKKVTEQNTKKVLLYIELSVYS